MRKRLLPLAEWGALLLFVLAAFFLPQTVFRMQDNLLWGRQVLSEREAIDVEAIGTAYERSIKRRMLQFAEGLTAGNQFYVTSQVLPIDQEIYDILYTDDNFHQEVLLYATDMGLLSWNVVWGEKECDITRWKQYVIYSDDYAMGVNFILWYIELKGSEGEILKLLMDAETYTIYAMKEENSFYLNMWRMGVYDSGEARLLCSWEEGIALWYAFSNYFGAITQEDMNRVVQEREGMTAKELEIFWKETAGPDSLLDVYMIYNIYGSEYMYSLGAAGWLPDFQEGRANVFSFPLTYDDMGFFDMVVDVREAESATITVNPYYFEDAYIYPDVTIGIRQIYEMIPEFLENSPDPDL